MKINDLIHGFCIKEIHQVNECNATLYKMEYEKTGTELIWLDSGEENKLFSITFKTLPKNDTGVFHILEHSVLNGSKKFPVKEPFVELLKSSMNTFLNAMTFPDKTMYPVSSRNEQDYLNLVEVYLDAVFQPAIYYNPNIFYQEGWHYELNDANETPIYKGVVFNEMKGAFSSSDTKMSAGLERLLYPDNCYQYVSGGDPKSIPNLSYEEFIQAHQEYYHPTNSKIYLDGNIPLEKTLQLIEEYLSKFERSTSKHEVQLQKEIQSCINTEYYEIGDEEDIHNKVQMGFGKIICDYADRKTQMAMMILSSYLTGSNESPLKKEILQKEIAQDIYISISDNIAQPYCSIIVKNTELENKEQIKVILNEVIDNIINNGINKEELEAILNEFEFQLFDKQEPKGLIRNINLLSSWLYDGDPLLYLENKEIMQELRKEIQTGYYEKQCTFFKEKMCEFYLLPSKTIGQEEIKEEHKRLIEIKNSWTNEEVESILTLNQKLIEWQQQEDTIENLQKLPVLSLNQIKPKLESLETKEIMIDNVKVLIHPISEKGITHLNLYFSLADHSLVELESFSFLTNLLGQLPTTKHNVETLQREIKKTIGYIDYNIQTFAESNHREECKPYFVVNCSCLDDKVNEAIELICEIVNETIFDSDESIQTIWNILMQCVEGMRQSIIGNGHRFALRRTIRNFNAESMVQEITEGYDFYVWLLDFAQNFKEKINEFISFMKYVQTNTFEINHLLISITSANIFTNLNLNLNKVNCEVKDTMHIELIDTNVNEIIQLPMNISYASMGTNIYKYGHSYAGSLRVLSTILTYDYLWNEIRVQGGAYGCGFQISINGNAGFYSYRDPNPLNSQEVYKRASAFIHEFCKQDNSLDKYIISTIASLEPLMTSRQKGNNEDYYYFSNISFEKRKQLIHEILNTTKEDIKECCKVLENLAYENSKCIIGNVEETQDSIIYKL